MSSMLTASNPRDMKSRRADARMVWIVFALRSACCAITDAPDQQRRDRIRTSPPALLPPTCPDSREKSSTLTSAASAPSSPSRLTAEAPAGIHEPFAGYPPPSSCYVLHLRSEEHT